MTVIITILTLIACLLLIAVVLIQNPKGGLAANFTSTNQVMGVRKTADFLEKATWTLGISLVVLSILSAIYTGNGKTQGTTSESEIQEQIDNAVIPNQGAPVMAPGQGQEQGGQPAEQPTNQPEGN